MVLAIHSESVAVFGGSSGLRDPGLLESALDRLRNLFAYGDAPSLFDLAAAYCGGLVRNHPFVDGNKRAGYLVGHTFLELNGFEFRPPEPEIVTMIMGLAAGVTDEAALAAWFSDYSMRRRG
jgi:death-on-curing protein